MPLIEYADIDLRIRYKPSLWRAEQDIHVLRGITGFFRPGGLTALMGASGCGKTTLLNLIAARMDSTPHTVTGSLLFDGRPASAYPALSRRIAYVTQGDFLVPHLTVRESLTFAAALSLPRWLSDAERAARVDSTLAELGLRDCADTLIGDGMTIGCSGGEKRRVSIALQLLTDPAVLILDEPTTGLDTFTALNIVSTLARLAAAHPRLTIIVSLHQPRADIFALFRDVTLLARGRVVYSGPRAHMGPYFDTLGLPCPAGANPADHYIDVTAVDSRTLHGGDLALARIEVLARHWRAHGAAEAAAAETLQQRRAQAAAEAAAAAAEAEAERAGRRVSILSSPVTRGIRRARLSRLRSGLDSPSMAALPSPAWGAAGSALRQPVLALADPATRPSSSSSSSLSTAVTMPPQAAKKSRTRTRFGNTEDAANTDAAAADAVASDDEDEGEDGTDRAVCVATISPSASETTTASIVELQVGEFDDAAEDRAHPIIWADKLEHVKHVPRVSHHYRFAGKRRRSTANGSGNICCNMLHAFFCCDCAAGTDADDNDDDSRDDEDEARINFCTQVYYLAGRFIKAVSRDRLTILGGFIQALGLSLWLGIVFFQLPGDIDGLRARTSVMYLSCTVAPYVTLTAQLYIQLKELAIFDAERPSRRYSPTAYLTARALTAGPTLGVASALASTAVYLMVGLSLSPLATMGRFVGINLISTLFVTALATFSAAVFRSFATASLLANAMFTCFCLGSGFFIQADSLPVFLRWMQYTSYIHHIFTALSSNEFSNRLYDCPLRDMDPDNPLCDLYRGNFVLRKLGVAVDNWTEPAFTALAMAVGVYLLAMLVLSVWKPGPALATGKTDARALVSTALAATALNHEDFFLLPEAEKIKSGSTALTRVGSQNNTSPVEGNDSPVGNGGGNLGVEPVSSTSRCGPFEPADAATVGALHRAGMRAYPTQPLLAALAAAETLEAAASMAAANRVNAAVDQTAAGRTALQLQLRAARPAVTVTLDHYSISVPAPVAAREAAAEAAASRSRWLNALPSSVHNNGSTSSSGSTRPSQAGGFTESASVALLSENGASRERDSDAEDDASLNALLAVAAGADAALLSSPSTLVRADAVAAMEHAGVTLVEPEAAGAEATAYAATEDRVQGDKLTLVRSVNAVFRPGELWAVLGGSGSGKSTLLSGIAQRLTSGSYKHDGGVYFNGAEATPALAHAAVGLVAQHDALLPSLTVHETLTYAARLRLPSAVSALEIARRVGDVIVELGLRECAHSIVGSEEVRGISGGEKRRLSIAVQLVTDPSVLLLDEPTSGLDAFTACNVMRTVQRLARRGRTVIATVHQPRADVAALFDSVLVLSKSRVVYAGPARALALYFSSVPAVLCPLCPPGLSPADWVLDATSVDTRSAQASRESRQRVRALARMFELRRRALENKERARFDVTARSSSNANNNGATTGANNDGSNQISKRENKNTKTDVDADSTAAAAAVLDAVPGSLSARLLTLPALSLTLAGSSANAGASPCANAADADAVEVDAEALAAALVSPVAVSAADLPPLLGPAGAPLPPAAAALARAAAAWPGAVVADPAAEADEPGHDYASVVATAAVAASGVVAGSALAVAAAERAERIEVLGLLVDPAVEPAKPDASESALAVGGAGAAGEDDVFEVVACTHCRVLYTATALTTHCPAAPPALPATALTGAAASAAAALAASAQQPALALLRPLCGLDPAMATALTEDSLHAFARFAVPAAAMRRRTELLARQIAARGNADDIAAAVPSVSTANSIALNAAETSFSRASFDAPLPFSPVAIAFTGANANAPHPSSSASSLVATKPLSAKTLQRQRPRGVERAGFCKAFPVLIRRSWVNLARQPNLLLARLWQIVAFGGMVAAFFWQLGRDQVGLANRIGLVTFSLSVVPVGMLNAVAIFPPERNVFYRERDDAVYGTAPFVASYLSTELFSEILGVVALTAVVGFAAAMESVTTATGFFTYAYVVFCLVFLGESLGTLFCAVVYHVGFAVSLVTTAIATADVMAGFLCVNSHIVAPLRYINYALPPRWAARVLAVLEFDGASFYCTPEQTLSDGTCPLTTGAQVLEMLEMQPGQWHVYLAALAATTVAFRTLALVVLHVRKPAPTAAG